MPQEDIRGQMLSPTSPTIKQKLPSFSELWKATFAFYKKRAKVVWLILLVPAVLGLLSIGLDVLVNSISSSNQTSPSLIYLEVISLVVMLVTAFFNFWAGVAVLLALKEENIGVKEAFRLAWGNLISFAWLGALSYLVILGGTLLFLVPGIIFSLQYALIFFVLINEGLKGKEAMLKSKYYIRGYWWAVFGREFLFSLVLGLLIGAPLALLAYLLNNTPQIQQLMMDIIAPIFQVFIAPVSVIFLFLIYQDLKVKKSSLDFVSTKKQRVCLTFWVVWAVVGAAALGALVVGGFLFALPRIKDVIQSQPELLNALRGPLVNLNINTHWLSSVAGWLGSLWH